MKIFKIAILGILLSGMSSCSNYLDIVPDNVATLDYAFRMRSTAQKYLFTCYSFLPKNGHPYYNQGLLGADEFWLGDYNTSQLNWDIARGFQNVNDPILDYWEGRNGGQDYWIAISQCNIFLEKIKTVPDMEDWEIKQWIAEVQFLKAYYQFFLLCNYGPISIIKENLPISASTEEVRIPRRPVDEAFNYIVELIDSAAVHLPQRVFDESTELGRITLPIALGMKAKILVYAASPLFNGNSDYQGFKNKDGEPLFSASYDESKWVKAAQACKEAIDLAHELNYKLYKFESSYYASNVSDVTKSHLTCRNTVTEKWNSEILWANTSSTTRDIQRRCQPQAMYEAQRAWTGALSNWGVTLNLASKFYTKNGVPIDEDVTWDYNNRFNLRVGTDNEKFAIKKGYTTAAFNFDREPRYYGSLGFDGGIWYGNGNYSDTNPYWLEMKQGQFMGKYQQGYHPVTGYFAKKLVYYTNTMTNSSTYVTTNYPWVMLRLGDLYLLYAEALNEVNGPTPEVFEYLDKIRAKASLKGVQESWTNFSRNPTKFTTKEGMREIIRGERTIEMALEGERYYDLRRWKKAPQELNNPIKGWDMNQSDAQNYYRPITLFNQTFTLKDYFSPIREQNLIVNKNLVQNPGW